MVYQCFAGSGTRDDTLFYHHFWTHYHFRPPLTPVLEVKTYIFYPIVILLQYFGENLMYIIPSYVVELPLVLL